MTEETGDGSGSRPAVGREIRRWRRERGLTLALVAERSGLNVGYLSQIENGKAIPSLDALVSIATALDVPAAWLLLDSTPQPRLVRAAQRPRVTTGGPDGSAASEADVSEVDGGTARDLSILEIVVQPGRSTGMHAHSGDEHHLVLTGRWRMRQGDQEYELGPGDYLAWDPIVPHDVENVGTEPARLLLIYARRATRSERTPGSPRSAREQAAREQAAREPTRP